MKTVSVSAKVLELCGIKSENASDLTIEETQAILNWCTWQSSDLWEGMNLQEILNVYRVSAEWVDWESWAEEDWEAAYEAWNNAIINPENKMIPRT